MYNICKTITNELFNCLDELLSYIILVMSILPVLTGDIFLVLIKNGCLGS